jgi:hypothetical protein
LFWLLLFCGGFLPFGKKLRSSSIFKDIEVVSHISSTWVRIRLDTKKQLHRLPGRGLKCKSQLWCGGAVVVMTDNDTTPTKLLCFVLSVRLLQ